MTRPDFRRGVTPQREMPTKVANRDLFHGSNVFSRWYYIEGTPDNMMYVIFSYGEHYPMYVWDQNARQWYANCEKSSRTTQRHKTSCQPFPDLLKGDKPDVLEYTTPVLRALYEHGSITEIPES